MKTINPTSVQTFKLIYQELNAELTVKIDFDYQLGNYKNGKIATVHDCIAEMVQFWTDWEHKVSINDDCFVKTFLQQLMIEACRIGIEYNWNLYGLQDYFYENTPEGYYPLNEIGINLLQWNTPKLEDDMVLVEIVDS